MASEHNAEFDDQPDADEADGSIADHQEDVPVEHAASEQPVDHAAAGAPHKNWYIIHTYSGFENKVAESLRTRAEAFGFTGQIGQILIPTEEVVELRNGKK